MTPNKGRAMSLFAQHAKLKAEYPDALLLMRVGDFYEAFDADADSLARLLGLTKTCRGDRRMAGFPHMQLQRYLPVLIKAGLRVAVAEPAPGSTIVETTRIEVRE